MAPTTNPRRAPSVVLKMMADLARREFLDRLLQPEHVLLPPVVLLPGNLELRRELRLPPLGRAAANISSRRKDFQQKRGSWGSTCAASRSVSSSEPSADCNASACSPIVTNSASYCSLLCLKAYTHPSCLCKYSEVPITVSNDSGLSGEREREVVVATQQFVEGITSQCVGTDLWRRRARDGLHRCSDTSSEVWACSATSCACSSATCGATVHSQLIATEHNCGTINTGRHTCSCSSSISSWCLMGGGRQAAAAPPSAVTGQGICSPAFLSNLISLRIEE